MSGIFLRAGKRTVGLRVILGQARISRRLLGCATGDRDRGEDGEYDAVEHIY